MFVSRQETNRKALCTEFQKDNCKVSVYLLNNLVIFLMHEAVLIDKKHPFMIFFTYFCSQRFVSWRELKSAPNIS